MPFSATTPHPLLRSWKWWLVPAAILLAAASAAGGAFADAPSGAREREAIDARAAFERLKSLVGRWTFRTDDGSTGEVHYKTTGAGSALVETLHPGTPHEMLTIYHLDGERLLLTHYCAVGNQPRMKLVAPTAADALVFEFEGGTNLDPGKDMHMHALTLRFETDDIVAQWTSWSGGKPEGGVRFVMKRAS